MPLNPQNSWQDLSSAEDTIFAMASGVGRAAIAVMRLSGEASQRLLIALTGRPVPPPRQASLRRLHDGGGGLLDVAIVLWLPGPGTYSGEDSAELHLHAGPAVIEGVAGALVSLGARPAEPGEFSRRAFLNARMGLSEAEAVVDLIAAETESQRSQALRQLEGGLGRVFDSWAARLRALLAHQEALIDFPDESGDVRVADADIRALMHDIEQQERDEHRGERLRTGLFFAVCGPPNVGKSSLVNVLAKREAAIVSPQPGTTRDLVEVRTVFGGVPVVLIDTAGLRASDDPVEIEGIRRARASVEAADLVLDVVDAQSISPAPPPRPGSMLIASKVDLAPAAPGRLGVSVVTGVGVAELREHLDAEAVRLTRSSGPAPLTQARHRAACVAVGLHLAAALAAGADDIRAEELRLAMRALGRLTGHVGVEELLDSVFSQFCIGK